MAAERVQSARGKVAVRDFVIDPGLPRLGNLLMAGDEVGFPVLDKMRAGLVKLKGDPSLHALLPQGEDPFIAAGPGLPAGFSADAQLFNFVRVQIGPQLQAGEQRRGDDGAVADGKLQKDGKPEVRPLLIFHRTADNDIFIPAAPVHRQTFRQPVDPLGEKVEHTIRPPADHLPAVRPPIIRVLQKKIRGKAGKNDLPARDFPAAVPGLSHRQIKGSGFPAQGGRRGGPIHFILPIDIAVFAASADFGASMPGVPIDIEAGVLCHKKTPRSEKFFDIGTIIHHLRRMWKRLFRFRGRCRFRHQALKK